MQGVDVREIVHNALARRVEARCVDARKVTRVRLHTLRRDDLRSPLLKRRLELGSNPDPRNAIAVLPTGLRPEAIWIVDWWRMQPHFL